MSRGCRRKTLTLPSPSPGVDRVTTLTVLGVQLNDRLTVTDHISGLLASCARQLYALRVLRAHGLPPTSLQDVYHATVMAKLLYCSPAWSGLCSVTDVARMDAFVRRSKRLGYCRPETPTFAELFSQADDDLFERINNSDHILVPLRIYGPLVSYTCCFRLFAVCYSLCYLEREGRKFYCITVFNRGLIVFGSFTSFDHVTTYNGML